ncbi:MAG: radical SAM protein [Peptococcaceae bacterium]|nr:radical SAM protein [Peptococcaceae bacterium]
MKTSMIADGLKILFGAIPGQLVIQITNHCNGACPQCGMRKTAAGARHILPPEKIKHTVKQCAEHGFEAVSFTGGEPFLNMNRLFDLLDDAGQKGIPYLRTGTNGYMLADADAAQLNDLAARLAGTKIRNFWISLDSADTITHETMRGLPGVTAGIRKALPVFHAHGVYPAANLGINRNIRGEPIPRLTESQPDEPQTGEPQAGRTTEANEFLTAFKDGFTAFFNKAIDLGFTMANVCYPMSCDDKTFDDPAYGAISDDYCVSFSPRERRLVFRALLETIPAFRNKIRIFSPLSVLYALSEEDDALMFPCLGGIRYFYMDSRDGRIYPCGYLGDRDLGDDLDEVVKQDNRGKPHCQKCHWECFRDPSQLFGLARYIVRHPLGALVQKKPHPHLLKLWFGDLRYYMKHDFFSGRTVPKLKEAVCDESRQPLQNGSADLPENG